MRAKFFSLAVALLTIVTLFGMPTLPVQAIAYGTSFTSSVTYQNVGSAATTTLSLAFYPAGSSTAINVPLDNLAKYAASSIYVGSLTSISTGFQGSAVLQSDQPMVATLVQVPPNTSSVRNRPLSNGFSAGAPSISIATVMKNAPTTSSFSIQNVDPSYGADLTVQFYAIGSTTPITDTVTNLPPGSSKYYNMGTFSKITTSTFNGSVKITAKQTGTNNDGAIVGSALELSTTSDAADAFESTSGGASTVYMPSAFCNYGSHSNITSYYAVQNIDPSADSQVTVNYSNGHHEGPTTIHAGNKFSFGGCDSASGNPSGFIGSAIVDSTGGQIVGIGKIVGDGLTTAFIGASSGSEKLAAPYVRYTTAHWYDGTRQRAFIAIQNVGSAVNAGDIKVDYYDRTGTLVGTDTNTKSLATGDKFSSSPANLGSIGAEFGFSSSGTGGAAIIHGPTGSQLVAIVRIQTYLVSSGGMVGEDYNAMPIN